MADTPTTDNTPTPPPADQPTPTPAPPAVDLQVLDLSAEPKRPTVKLPAGDYEMRVPEELTFDQFAAIAANGKEVQAISPKAEDPEVMVRLQDLVAVATMQMLIGLDDETARTITPGMYLKISAFFKRLGDEVVASPSASGSSLPHGVSGSTEADHPAA